MSPINITPIIGMVRRRLRPPKRLHHSYSFSARGREGGAVRYNRPIRYTPSVQVSLLGGFHYNPSRGFCALIKNLCGQEGYRIVHLTRMYRSADSAPQQDLSSIIYSRGACRVASHIPRVAPGAIELKPFQGLVQLYWSALPRINNVAENQMMGLIASIDNCGLITKCVFFIQLTRMPGCADSAPQRDLSSIIYSRGACRVASHIPRVAPGAIELKPFQGLISFSILEMIHDISDKPIIPQF